MPRYYDVFIPVSRRHEGTEATVVNELLTEKVIEEKKDDNGVKVTLVNVDSAEEA